MQIPNKLQHGDNIRTSVFNTVNAIIDYLHASKLRKSAGIDVVESPSGTTLNLVQKSSSVPQVQPVSGGTANQDLSVSISGNTATVSLSGSTQTVQFVAGSNVSITGNTNGQVIVSATGGTVSPTSFGPPDYSNPIDFININTSFPATFSYNYPVWITGYAEGKTWDLIQYLELEIWSLPPGHTMLQAYVLIDTGHTTEDPSSRYTVPVCILIPANTEILFHTGSYDTPDDIQLAICPCLTS